MKKLIKNIVTLTAAFAIVTNAIPISATELSRTGGEELKNIVEQNNINNEYSMRQTILSITEEEKQALNDNEELKHKVMFKNKNGKEKYANYYGGSYINDNDNLVIQFTKDVTKEEMNNVVDVVSDEAIIQKVEYSYDELLNEYYNLVAKLDMLMENIDNGIATDLEEKLGENVIGIGVSQKENANVVTLNDVSEESEKEFIEYFNESNVVFKKGDKNIEYDSTTIRQGQRFIILENDNYYYIGSVGPRMVYTKADGSEVLGFLTAAHCVAGKGDNVYFYNSEGYITKFGTVTRYKYGGCADIAFVKQKNTEDFTISRYTAYSNKNGNTTAKYKTCHKCCYAESGIQLIEGATVYKCGAKTYLTKGKILHLDYTEASSEKEETRLTHRMIADYDSAKGDSGGLVFTIHNSDTFTFDVAGVHNGTISSVGKFFTSIERYDEFVLDNNPEDIGFNQF